MNKLVEEELKKIKSNVEKISDTEYRITNSRKQLIKFNEDKGYIIKLANYITNPPSNFTLQDNWNNGVIPKSNYMEIRILKKIGKMHCVYAIGLNKTESGFEPAGDAYDRLWLPEAGMFKIKEII